MNLIDPNFPKLIIPSVWYPARNGMLMTRAAAEDLGYSLEKYCIEQNEFNLRNDLNGVYRFFLRVGGPQRVLKSTPQMAKTHTNSFIYEIIENEQGRHRCRILIPSEFAEWNLFMVKGGIHGILNTVKCSIKSMEVISEDHTISKGDEWKIFELLVIYQYTGLKS